MPEWLQTALWWAVMIVLLVLLAAVPATVTAFFGAGWGIIAMVAAGFGVAHLLSQGPDGAMGMAGPALFAGVALVVGLIVGIIIRLVA